MVCWTMASNPHLGVWVKLPAPEVLEVLASGGADFVVLDCEHGAFDQRTMSTMVGVARGLGLTVFVRVAGTARSHLQPPLDAGADGLFIPHVDDAATARQVVGACRFPPIGSRAGSPATRAGDWGRRGLADYVARGNSQVVIVAQIESAAAAAAAADIAAVEGLDAVFIGPFDLALSSGLSPLDPQFQAMIAGVEMATQHSMLGGVATTPTEVRELAGRGYNFLMVGADTSLLAGAVESAVTRSGEVVADRLEGPA